MKKGICLLLTATLLLAAMACAQAENVVINSECVIEQAPEGEQSIVLWRGERAYDALELLSALLGEDFVQQDTDRFAQNIEGEVWEKKQVRIDEETGEFWYYDPMVASERGAEYEPPAMNCTREQALQQCETLLQGVLPEEWELRLSGAAETLDRWNGEEKRWMDDGEYDALCTQRQTMNFSYCALAGNGLRILDEGVNANIGADGLAGFSVQMHAFAEGEGRMEIPPVDEAIALVSAARQTPTTLLYACPVYSSRVSEDGSFRLCWMLTTAAGTYLVDCRQGTVYCDMMEQ